MSSKLNNRSIGKIIKIKKHNNKYIGYEFFLENKNNILLLIENIDLCCEEYCAFMHCVKKIDDFEKILNGIKCNKTDVKLVNKNIIGCKYFESCNTEKVDRDNNKIGVILEFEDVYCIVGLMNEHNGFYAHKVIVEYNDVKIEDEL